MNKKILKIKIRTVIKNCVYYDKEQTSEYFDNLTEYYNFEIHFNVPPADLQKLNKFCKINNVYIEYYNKHILITFEK